MPSWGENGASNPAQPYRQACESVGSYRYRVTFKGPGGHSYGAFGLANPIHGLGRALAAIADFETAKQPKTTFNVGRIGGSTSVNSIPFEAWAEVDMRRHDRASLEAVDRKFHEAVDRALESENARWGGRGALRPAEDTRQALTLTRIHNS